MATVGSAETTIELVKALEKRLIVARRSVRGAFVHGYLYPPSSKPPTLSYKTVI